MRDFMKNVMHSFLSKEGAFTDFPEGLQALALTSSGHEKLNILLSRTQAQIVDIWACELETPKLSDTNSLDECYIFMQECVTLHKSSNRKFNPIE